MKLLYILNVANRVNNFSYAAMLAAKELGIEFWIAGKWGYASAAQREADAEKYGIHIVQLDLDRSPYSMQNRVAYKQLCDLIRKEHIDAIHCNTPVGGMLGRLAGKACGVDTVIYQVHGFHFYRGAPWLSWCTYYPVEKWLAHKTDALITINHEDYNLACRKMKLRRHGKVYYVPGVGIDVSAYATEESVRPQKRAETGLSDTDVALISMGDLIPRKNYDTAIRAIAAAEDPALQYLICGKGPEEDNLKALAERLGVAGQIHFLGFRSDIKELLAAADIFLFTTRQEGLPRSMMEAMASGLPCVASRIRGNTDLLEGTDGGFLCDADDAADFADKIKRLAADPALRAEMGAQNRLTLQKFSTAAAKDALEAIYKDSLRWVNLDAFIQSLADYFPMRERKRTELGIGAGDFVLVSAGRLEANKNNGTLIRALHKAAHKNIRLLLCGEGEARDALADLAASLGVADRVIFAGNRRDMPDIYHAVDALALASHREGLSRTVMEAMACGLPCVVSGIRGNVDLIAHGENGFVCDADDADAYAAAMDALAADGDLCRTLGAHNREKVRGFAVEVVKARLAEIYRTVLLKEKEQNEDIAFAAK